MARHETRPDDPAPWPLLRELGPEAFKAIMEFAEREGLITPGKGMGPLDLWAFTLGWLATRTFTDRYVVTCPACSGLGYRDEVRVGSDEDLDAAEIGLGAVHADLGFDGYWRITTRTWCSSCYGDDEGELGKLELTVSGLIDRATDAAPVVGGVRDHLAVLADGLQAAGDPWGLWIAALLSGPVGARQEHEEALARAVRAEQARSSELQVLIGEATASVPRGPAPGNGPPSIIATGGLEAIGSGIQAAAAALGSAVSAAAEFNRAVAQVGASIEGQGVFDELRRTMAEIGGILEKPRPGLEAADPTPRHAPRFGPVGDRLRRRLSRGRW